VGLAEPYAANDKLKPEFLTQQDDILVRLSAPYTAALVDDESADYVVPSHFAIIRVDKSKVDPAYVLWILRQQSTLKQIYQNVSGSVAFGTINSSFFNDLKIDIIPLEKQRLIGAVLKLSEREQTLLSELAKAKAELNMAIMANAYKNLNKGK
jgi:restriction endonuclease S subunit